MNISEMPVREMSCQALAYLGDGVLELMVRERLVRRGLMTAANLNRHARQYVTAPAQCAAMQRILPLLTEEEEGYYRRGRNNVHANVPKHATMTEYRMATGMECLFAYLYLTGARERLSALFEAGYPEDGQPSDG